MLSPVCRSSLDTRDARDCEHVLFGQGRKVSGTWKESSVWRDWLFLAALDILGGRMHGRVTAERSLGGLGDPFSAMTVQATPLLSLARTSSYDGLRTLLAPLHLLRLPCTHVYSSQVALLFTHIRLYPITSTIHLIRGQLVE